MVAEHTHYIAITGSTSLLDTPLLGELGGTGNALKAGRPSPWACDPRAVSTRGWNLMSGATRTQTSGSIH